MIWDRLVFSLIEEGLKYWQHFCEAQHAFKDAAKYKLNIAKFTTLHKNQRWNQSNPSTKPVYCKEINHHPIWP